MSGEREARLVLQGLKHFSESCKNYQVTSTVSHSYLIAPLACSQRLHCVGLACNLTHVTASALAVSCPCRQLD